MIQIPNLKMIVFPKRKESTPRTGIGIMLLTVKVFKTILVLVVKAGKSTDHAAMAEEATINDQDNLSAVK